MKRNLLLIAALLLLSAHSLPAQLFIKVTSGKADQALRGNHDPAAYQATTVLNHPTDLVQGILNDVSADTLRAYLEKLESFRTRNTGSDTVSATNGIGAARRWAHQKFAEFSALNENRLIPAYLQFNQNICSMTQHRNPIAVLPGMDTTDNSIIIIEGHLDSRCDVACDVNCVAYGADDNGSGSVLVLELARIMSRFSFNHTICFMLTIGEEQGLYGANAFAEYCANSGIKIKAVLNNDIVGGVICGSSASPPGCSPTGSIDSLNLRIYSFGGFNSEQKMTARYSKLEYQEELKPLAAVPMTLNIMEAEDRSGRGGDHIPFRQRGYRAIRFTSANEHGDGAPGPGYTDHQHTSEDSIGVDTDGDGDVDSLWVDFNYLARNAQVNATAAAMMGIGPARPDMMTATAVPGGAVIDITTSGTYPAYRVGVRTLTNDWDSVYTMTSKNDTIWGLAPGLNLFQAANVDTNGIESLFSFETSATIPVSNAATEARQMITLRQNVPNPMDDQTRISVFVTNSGFQYDDAYISIRDLHGREIKRLPITLHEGMNEVLYNHGFNASGVYLYSLVVDDVMLETKRMVFR